MVLLTELTEFLDSLLDIHAIPGDKSNNGLQIEGKSKVEKVAGGVDACFELYKETAASSVDFIFVHHGESWGDGMQYFTDRTARRFELLFRNGISLYAAHLPLDAHPRLGHNVNIATSLGLDEIRPFAKYASVDIGVFGNLPSPLSMAELVRQIDQRLKTKCVAFDFCGQLFSRIGIISGSGAAALYECKNLGIDCLVTGEVDHTSYHPAKELGVSLVAAGHYKTEVPGIIAVLNEIQDKFRIDCEFVDIPTGL